MEKLVEKGIEATGTVMTNRIKGVNLQKKKMKRGESKEYVRTGDKIVVTEWMDNQKVVLASTCSGIEPLSQVERWSKAENKYIKIDRPSVVGRYNQSMGGVDVFDQQLECYRTWFKTRKWTLKTILHFVDFSTVNSWMQYREDAQSNQIPKKKTYDLLKFRKLMAEALLSTPNKKRKDVLEEDEDCTEGEGQTKRKCYTPSNRPVADKRYDGYDHWPTVDDIKSPRMCRMEECKSRTKTRCEKCDCYLCLSKDKNCFKAFHVK